MQLIKDTYCSYCGQAYALDQAWPRMCAACGNTTYRNPLPVAVLLVPVGGGLLTVRRAIPPRIGQLALPGGYIGVGESWQAAGVREVAEETGLMLAAETVTDFRVLSAPDGTVLVFGLAAPCAEEALAGFVPNSECSEVVIAYKPQELAFPLHTAALREYFARQG